MNKAPEPTEQDIARAASAKAIDVFAASDGRLTVAYYRRLQAIGPMGIVALNLFRASKTSSRAKVYRGRRFRSASYDVKNYSLEQLCKVLQEVPEITWGWKEDPDTPGFEWVLYCELPNGQCSFHSPTRLSGPAFKGEWDGQHLSTERILEFVDAVANGTLERYAKNGKVENRTASESLSNPLPVPRDRAVRPDDGGHDRQDSLPLDLG